MSEKKQLPKLRRNGAYLVFRISHKGKIYQWSSGVKIPNKFDFNTTGQRLTPKKDEMPSAQERVNATSINKTLLKKREQAAIDISNFKRYNDTKFIYERDRDRENTPKTLPKVIEKYKTKVNKHGYTIKAIEKALNQYKGQKHIDSIDGEELYSHLRAIHETATANQYMTILARIVFVITSKKLHYSKSRPQKKIPEFLTKEEIKTIEDSKPKTKSLKKIKAVSMVLYLTGLRYSDCKELVSIFKQNPNTNEITLRIRKTRDLKRIEITPRMREHLTNAEVFTFEWFNRKVKLLMDEVGISKHVTPHTFRRSFATNLLRAGVEVHKISKLMNHSNISTTYNYLNIEIDQLNTEELL